MIVNQNIPDVSTISLAVKVIRNASVTDPADRVLRSVLRAQKGLPRGASAEVASMVFKYFRWKGWLKPEDRLEDQIAEAVNIAERWGRRPDNFSPVELRAKAIPAWALDEITFSPTWIRTLQEDPILWLRARRGHADPLLERFPATLSRKIPGALAYGGKEDLFGSVEFHSGEFEIQDIASQAVGLVCGARRGETWWDACAGEGGKTLYLSESMDNSGLIWASDRSKRRLANLRQRAARAQCFNYRVAEWDGSNRLPTKTKFDGVLLDAPCSGVGTWARNPHARWTTTREDVHELAKIQLNLLTNCSKAVKPGGRLIYSVCTLTNAETSGVVDAFQAVSPDFIPLAIPSPFDAEAPKSARQTWWTQYTGGNGMFIAIWKRAPAAPVVAAPATDATQ